MRTRMTKKEQLLRIRDEFRAEHDNAPATARDMGEWAVATGRYKLPPHATERKCAEELADAMAMDMTTVSGGRRVRTMHTWRSEQRNLWDHIATISTPDFTLSMAYQRNGALGIVKQMKTDLDYFNELHPDGPAVQVSFNFENDLADAGLLNFSSSENEPRGVRPPGTLPPRGLRRGPSRPSSRQSGPSRGPTDSAHDSPPPGT